MFEMSAPYPALQTTSLLPSPQFSDSEAITDALDIKRSKTGVLYTYVKTKNLRRKLQWTFLVTRNKALEIRAFIMSYAAHRVRIVDHNGRIWIGYLMNNPAEFNHPRPETQDITIEFEGVEQV